MPGKELPQIFPWITQVEIGAQNAFNRFRRLRSGATISDGTRKSGILAHRAAQAEIVGIHHLTVDLDLLAFQSNVGQPMLPATVGTSSNVESQFLIEGGQAVFEFFHQPACKALGFCDSQLAELGAGASHGPTPERRSRYMKPG